MKIDYNLENNTREFNIELDLSKKIHLIYGPNGSGKSTLARKIYTDFEKDGKTMVHLFNSSYIANNIYVSESTSDVTSPIKTKVQNEQNLSELFVGENIKESIDLLMRLKELKQKVPEFCESEVNFNDLNLVKTSDQEERLFLLYLKEKKDDIKTKIIKRTKPDFKAFNSITVSELTEKSYELIEIKINQSKPSSIADDIFLDEYHKITRGHVIIQLNKLLEKIRNQDVNFKSLEATVKNYNKVIENLDDFLKIQSDIKEKFDSSKIDLNNPKLKEWIKTSTELHEKMESKKCLFCANNRNCQLEKEYIDYFKNTIEQSKTNLHKELLDIKKFFNEVNKIDKEVKTTILAKKSIFDKSSSNVDVIDSFINLINQTKRIEFENIKSFSDEEKKEIDVNAISEEIIIDYLIDKNSKYVDEIKKDYFKNNFLKMKETEINGDMEIKTEESKRILESALKTNKIFLGLMKNEIIKISVNKSSVANKSKTPKLSIMKNDRPLITCSSDGERFKLGLLLFLLDTKNKINSNPDDVNHLIVLDDPIDLADVFTYFSFSALFEGLKKEFDLNNIHWILLTHNIDFLYTLLECQQENERSKSEIIRISKQKESTILEYSKIRYTDRILFIKLHKKIFLEKPTSDQDQLIFYYLCFVRRFFEEVISQVIYENTGENYYPIDDKGLAKKIERIETSEKLNEEQLIVVKCIKTINTSLNKWFDEKKTIKFEEFIKISQVVEKILNDYLNCSIKNLELSKTKEEFNISDFPQKYTSKEYEIYWLISKLWTIKKEPSNDKVYNEIKNYLRHGTVGFMKPYIAFDREIIENIIDDVT